MTVNIYRYFHSLAPVLLERLRSTHSKEEVNQGTFSLTSETDIDIPIAAHDKQTTALKYSVSINYVRTNWFLKFRTPSLFSVTARKNPLALDTVGCTRKMQ